MRVLRLLVPTILLLLVAAVVVVAATQLFSREQRALIRSSSQYVTLEWNLLAQLKAETDRLLQEKDEEIVAIRRQLAALYAQENPGETGASETESRLLRAIDAAYAERRAIERARRPVEPENTDNALGDLLPNEESTALVPAAPGREASARELGGARDTLDRIRLQQLNRQVVGLLTTGQAELADQNLREMRSVIDQLPSPAAYTLPVAVERQHGVLSYLSGLLWDIRALESEGRQLSAVALEFERQLSELDRGAEPFQQPAPPTSTETLLRPETVFAILEAIEQGDAESSQAVTAAVREDPVLQAITYRFQSLALATGPAVHLILPMPQDLGAVLRAADGTGRGEVRGGAELAAGDRVLVGPPGAIRPDGLCEAVVQNAIGTRVVFTLDDAACRIRSGDRLYVLRGGADSANNAR